MICLSLLKNSETCNKTCKVHDNHFAHFTFHFAVDSHPTNILKKMLQSWKIAKWKVQKWRHEIGPRSLISSRRWFGYFYLLEHVFTCVQFVQQLFPLTYSFCLMYFYHPILIFYLENTLLEVYCLSCTYFPKELFKPRRLFYPSFFCINLTCDLYHYFKGSYGHIR